MRKYLPAFLLIFLSSATYAQVELGLGYSLGVPLQKMAKHIQPAHQALLSGSYRLPIQKIPTLWAGLEIGTGSYGHKTIEQTFQFSDGTTTRTDVRYNSNIAYAAAVLRYEAPVKGPVIPYAKLSGGYMGFYTNIFIEDPENPDGCAAMDNDLVLSDGNFVVSYGGGLRILLKKSKTTDADYMLDLNVDKTMGGKVDYLNVRHLGEHHDPGTGSDPEAKPLTTRFINVNTQNIHEHQLAEVYTSPIRLLQVRLGFVMKINKVKK